MATPTAAELVDRIRAYNPACDADLITRAYDYSERMHRGQKRRSGEPYFTHPVAVAEILARQQMDDATIATALLHDTVEDTNASHPEVSRLFGEEIALLVDGVTKLTNLQISSVETKQAENFRKLFMATARDLRVIVVKLADRLHNMRTIKAMRPEKQVQKARETMEIYAPLAGRMGMQAMRESLEDIAFHVLNPEARSSIMRRFVTLQKEAGEIVPRITADIQAELDAAGIRAEVRGRAKKPYSIWRKMQAKDQTFSRLSDIYGFRVIVETEADCYRTLGVIHQRRKAVFGRFKDYISQPKDNGYRSIHTAVLGRDGKRVEVQIRTREMHEVAETGVAAHWSYKEGERVSNRFAVDPVKWITALSERFENDENHDEFLEAVKLEMYTDQVFCFTPKGEVVKLPRGATPIDFAYAIHTDLGTACVGAKVDGRRLPLWTRLKNGQSVEIITAEGQKPQVAWMEIAITGRAKSAIRRSLRAEGRVREIRLGRELLRAAFEGRGRAFTQKALETAALGLSFEDADDLLEAVGQAELKTVDVLGALWPELAEVPGEVVDQNRAVVGLAPDQSHARAECCQPVPGERIVGIARKGQGVQVHAIDCPCLAECDDALWIDLKWQDGVHPPVYKVSLDATITNSAGVLGRICSLVGESAANISNLVFRDRKPDYYRLTIEVELRDAEHLHRVRRTLEADNDVATIRRHRGPCVKAALSGSGVIGGAAGAERV